MIGLGPLAQLAEQLTLNQPVEGSSPSRLTQVQIQNPSSAGRVLSFVPAMTPVLTPIGYRAAMMASILDAAFAISSRLACA
jgi:hypothetical protein